MTNDSNSKATRLLERYPNLKEHQGKRYLVKYGGAAMENSEVRDAVCEEIALLAILGLKLVVVHGGGKEISRTLDRLGISSHFVEGLRVTSDDAMAATEMVLSGAVNKDLASRITRSGAPAVGLSGRDAHILEGVKRNSSGGEYLGLVGEVVACDSRPITALLDSGFVPVVSPVAETVDGTPLNVNADYAAAALAGTLAVSGCVFLTDVDGVKQSDGIVNTLTPASIEEMIASTTITGGMIPKVRCAIEALRSGCQQAIICNAARPAIVSLALTRSPDAGTAVVRDR